jgi:hypothetical protein
MPRTSSAAFTVAIVRQKEETRMSIMPIRATELTTRQPFISTSVASVSVPKSQPLWRFALVGLGPLSAMGVFALVLALFQRLG